MRFLGAAFLVWLSFIPLYDAVAVRTQVRTASFSDYSTVSVDEAKALQYLTVGYARTWNRNHRVGGLLTFQKSQSICSHDVRSFAKGYEAADGNEYLDNDGDLLRLFGRTKTDDSEARRRLIIDSFLKSASGVLCAVAPSQCPESSVEYVLAGKDFSRDFELNLNGRADYALTSIQSTLPFAIIEAKSGLTFDRGVHQLFAQLIYLKLSQTGSNTPVYGAVSDGIRWQFAACSSQRLTAAGTGQEKKNWNLYGPKFYTLQLKDLEAEIKEYDARKAIAKRSMERLKKKTNQKLQELRMESLEAEGKELSQRRAEFEKTVKTGLRDFGFHHLQCHTTDVISTESDDPVVWVHLFAILAQCQKPM